MSTDDASAGPSLTVITPSGGIMTREVGAITGDVELWLDPSDPNQVRVRYVGADEDYTVVGSAEGRSLDDVAAILVADPGVDADGNPVASHL